MMRWKCSGPLVQVKGVGLWLYCFRYRSRKSFNSFLERCTLCVKCLSGENAEKAFDHVHPGGMSWGVMEMHSRMAQEPLFGGFIFVDIEVVQDNMEFTEGVGLYNIIHETQEVYRGPAVPDMGDDFAGGDFQSGQQRLRAMPDIFVGPGTDFSCSQGQQRLGPVECLNAGFLIHAQHQSIFRGIEIQPENVQQLGIKIGVGAEGEGTDAMRLQLGGHQHGVYCTGGQSQFGGQGANAPAALMLGLLTHPGLHLVSGVGIMLGRPSRTWRIAQALKAVDSKGATPLSDRDRRDL